MIRACAYIVLTICLLFFNLKAQLLTHVAGDGYCCNFIYGVPATTASLYYPFGLSHDQAGNIYIAEGNAVRKVDVNGLTTLAAGTGTGGYTGDGGPAISARVRAEGGLAIDALGNMYICDWSGKVIRKVNSSGIISTIAGLYGTPGSTGDGGPAINALLNAPHSIAVDATGNIFIGEFNKIRKINSSGNITTVAGIGSSTFSGDNGPAVSAAIYQPMAITFDNAGDLLFCDWGNHRVRKINAAGIISTIAGNGISAFQGDSGLAVNASLNNPSGIVVDQTGNIFIADMGNGRIRMIDSLGIITTIAGTGNYSCTLGGTVLNASFGQPVSVMLDGQGELYILDRSCYLLHKMSNPTVGMEEESVLFAVQVFPNPASTELSIETDLNGIIEAELSTVQGCLVNKFSFTKESKLFIADLNNGIYILRLFSNTYVLNKKIIVSNE